MVARKITHNSVRPKSRNRTARTPTVKPPLTTPIPRRRWRIAWLLSLGVLVNYFDRVNLSVSHEALYTTFGISNVAFGYLSGAYNWTYAMCQLPVGVLLDKFGIRRVGRISIFLWSIASFAAAVTPGLGGFFAARFLLGVGEAPTFPANAKAIGYWFPTSERSFATSIFDSSAKFSSAIGVPLLGLLLLKIGWRWSFAATGIISLLYFLLFWKIYSDPRALIWISISIGGLSAAAPVGWSIPSLIAPRSSVGSVGGILNFSNQLSGIAAPIVTGYLVAARQSFAWAFGVAAIYLLIGIAAYIVLLGKIEPIPSEPQPAT